jgi:hypothetical protein
MITGVLLPKLRPGMEVTAEDFALIMVCCKMSRLVQSPGHEDSMVDAAGYINTYFKVVTERRRREEAARQPKESGVPSEINHGEIMYVKRNGEFHPVGVVEHRSGPLPVHENGRPMVPVYQQQDGPLDLPPATARCFASPPDIDKGKKWD